MPERDVLERRHGVAADDAREAADALAQFGVALVRHGAGAGLSLAEGLLNLQDLGALEVAELRRHSLEAGAR